MSDTGRQLQTAQQPTQPAVADPLVDANRDLAGALAGPFAPPTDRSIPVAPVEPTAWYGPGPEKFLAPDETEPEVIEHAPEGLAADVASNVTARFSEPMDPATLVATDPTTQKPKNVTLVEDKTTDLVPAKVSYNPRTRTVTLDPEGDLKPGTSYRATVQGGPGGIKDLAGNELGGTSWTFTTAQKGAGASS